MKHTFRLIFILTGALFLACSPAYYSPDPHFTPNFSEKGEVNAGANIGISNNSYNFGFQGAYAVTDHIALKSNFNKYLTNTSPDETFSGSGALIEIAPGFHSNLSDKLVFESYALVALGNVENVKNGNKLNADILRYGIQPSLGYKSKTIEIILSTRLVSLNHYNIVNNIDLLESQELTTDSRNFLVEPGFTFKLGSPEVKFVTQLNLSFNVTSPEFRQERTYLGAGLNINLNALDLIRK